MNPTSPSKAKPTTPAALLLLRCLFGSRALSRTLILAWVVNVVPCNIQEQWFHRHRLQLREGRNQMTEIQPITRVFMQTFNHRPLASQLGRFFL